MSYDSTRRIGISSKCRIAGINTLHTEDGQGYVVIRGVPLNPFAGPKGSTLPSLYLTTMLSMKPTMSRLLTLLRGFTTACRRIRLCSDRDALGSVVPRRKRMLVSAARVDGRDACGGQWATRGLDHAHVWRGPSLVISAFDPATLPRWKPVRVSAAGRSTRGARRGRSAQRVRSGV